MYIQNILSSVILNNCCTWFEVRIELLTKKQTVVWSSKPTLIEFKNCLFDFHNSEILFYDFDVEQYPEINEMLEIDSIPFFASYYNGKLIEATSTTKDSKIESMISYLLGVYTQIW